MSFITPELFIRFNSSDDEEADLADEEWETAIRAYRKHLDKLREQMSSQVQELAALCLHDAKMLARHDRVRKRQPPSAGRSLHGGDVG